jgi:radical SAM family RiPP maturation amino acid epimerase
MTAPLDLSPQPALAPGEPELRPVFGMMKRFGEWYLASAEFRAAADADPGAAAAGYGLPLRDAEARALLRRDLFSDAADLDGVPDTVLAFREHRRFFHLRAGRWRRDGEGADPRFHAWRQYQVARCEIEFGLLVNSQIVHAPAAVELQQGCSVGCWFCGVSADTLGSVPRYDPPMAGLWAEVVAALHETCGAALASGILYWATDPLDNPDYERFLAAWEERVGQPPQTTTAQPLRHLDRVRALVARSQGAHAGSMRISVLSLPVLRRLFATFTPEELLGTELVLQMPDAASRLSRAGRAASSPRTRGAGRLEPDDDDATRTIACASGFLVNMAARKVRMITPCHASPQAPEGYRCVGEGSFTSGAEFRALLGTLVAAQVPAPLTGDTRLRLRPPLRYQLAFDGFDLHTVSHRLRLRSRPGLEIIGPMVAAGTAPTVTDVIAACAAHGVPPDQARATLDALQAQAVFDDAAGAGARPVTVAAG